MTLFSICFKLLRFCTVNLQGPKRIPTWSGPRLFVNYWWYRLSSATNIAIYIEYAKLNSIDIEATSIYWQNRYVTTMLKCFSIIPVEVWS